VRFVGLHGFDVGIVQHQRVGHRKREREQLLRRTFELDPEHAPAGGPGSGRLVFRLDPRRG
jgi:hypothetical protein